VLAHRPSLQRVLVNLLDNAIDAMKEGGTVTIACEKQADKANDGYGIVITVDDTGTGIPPALMPKIFDIFFTTKPPGQGTGLGLAICHEIVEAHGGTLDIKSSLGEGTRARIFLPAQAGSAQRIAGAGT
jgi:two-component system NtrC family sensor kinase